MRKNMSKTDRIVRIITAGIFLLTGFIGVCPFYALFGLSTKKAGK